MCSCDFFLGLLALLFPPIAVWVKRGICSADSIINILLCMLGYLPGLFHAWYIIVKYPEPEFAYDVLAPDSEGAVQNSRFTYVVVHPSNGRQPLQPQSAAPKIQSNMNYGTSGTATEAPAAGPAAASSSSAPAQQFNDDAGEGGSHGPPPPTYDQAVSSDNKIQNHD